MRSHCVLLVLFACTSAPLSTPDAIVVGAGGKFDDGSVATFHVCRVIRGDGEGFNRVDTLECEVEAGSLVTPILEVWSADRFVGTLRLEEGAASQAFSADRYPLEVRAHASLVGVSGLEGYQLRTTTLIEDDGSWDELRGPALPIKLWSVTFETTLGRAEVQFDEQLISPAGGVLTRGESDAGDVAARPLGALVDPATPVTMTVAVGTTLTGQAGLLGGTLVPFEVDAGGTYQVTDEGLVSTVEPPGIGADVVGCETVESVTTCRIRNPAFVASATVDGVELPLDGEGVVIAGTEPMEAAVQVSSAIALVDAERLGPFTRTLERDGTAGNRSVVELPFDVLDVSTFITDVTRASFATDESHALYFRGPWNGAFQQSGRREVVFEGEHTFVAVSPDETSLTGELRITSSLGMGFDDPSFTLESGSWVISPEGMVPSSNLEPGVELARCWLVEGQLQCSRAAPEVVETVTLEMVLESFGHTLTNEIERQAPDADSVASLARFLPVTLTLIGTKSGEEVRVTTRMETLDDLSDGLVLVTP